MKKLSYRNEAYEEQVRKELSAALDASQKLLDCWNELKLVPLENLFELIHNPAGVYKRAVHAVSADAVTLGRYAIRPGVMLDIIDVPIPNELYLAARDAKKHIQCGRPQLWSIVGDKVVMNQAEAEQLIHENDVIVETEMQDVFVEACKEYAKSGKVLHDVLTKLPGQGMFQGIPFVIREKYGTLIAWLEIEPVQLRGILDQMKQAGL